MRATRASRVLRGALAASIATFAALVSHVTAGGEMPGWLGIAVPLVLSLAVCTVLVGRHVSLWRLSLAVALSQFLFHALFVLGAFSADATETLPHHTTGAVTAVAATVHHSHADGPMWMLHAAAALVTVALLHRGERTLAALRGIARDLVRWAHRRIIAALATLPVAGRPAPISDFADPRPAAGTAFLTAVTHRGPPLARAL